MTERIEPVELTGLMILLERMKTHPEEFVTDYDREFTRKKARWDGILNNASSFMTEEEFFKLEKGLRDCARTVFNGKVLEVLAGQGHDELGVELKNQKLLEQDLLEQQKVYNNALRQVIDDMPVEVQRTRSRMI
jgi:hypothetical protein